MRPDTLRATPAANTPPKPLRRGLQRPPSDEPLTEKEFDMLNYLADYLRANQSMPSVRDTCDFFGWRSPNAPTATLRSLEEKGYLESSQSRHARSYRLLGCKAVLVFDDNPVGQRLREALEGESRQTREIGDGHP